MRALPISIPQEALAEFCKRHQVRNVALFGSVLRDGFGPASDVDVLVEFDPQARHDLWDLFYMKEELERLFGRTVDLVNREALEQSRNWIRRRAILESAEIVYAAG